VVREVEFFGRSPDSRSPLPFKRTFSEGLKVPPAAALSRQAASTQVTFEQNSARFVPFWPALFDTYPTRTGGAVALNVRARLKSRWAGRPPEH
jgi:hypothetical protein